MNDTDDVLRRLRAHGIPVNGRDTAPAVRLALRWLESAGRVRSAVENAVDPAVGPATVYAHTPNASGR